MKVFLGGTVNNSKWRDYMMPRLEIEYFNPVVEEWNDEAYQKELDERINCDYCLYILTPKMTGFYSLAEVADDSYKRPDRTIFCFVHKDEEDVFTSREVKIMENIGKKVEENGGLCFDTIDNVIEYLNSSKNIESGIEGTSQNLNDFFISYGRRHSKEFATKLYNRLNEKGIQTWFDQNNIPLGVDFQEQINDGIIKSTNFIFVISPHSVRSEYCLREIVLAVELKKRIIPILHIEPKDDWDKMHPTIEKLNWIYFQEGISNFDNSFKGLIDLYNSHKDYVGLHTKLLNRALEWEQKQKVQALLLIGTNRKNAEEWLNVDFEETQAPCLPTDLQCEYICTSKEVANDNLCDVFLCFDHHKDAEPLKFRFALMQKGITTWTKETHVRPGDNAKKATNDGIEKSSNFIYFASKNSLKNSECQSELIHAIKYNKNIIPVLLDDVNVQTLPHQVRSMFMLDYITKTDKNYSETLSRLLLTLGKDKEYHELHRDFLVKAIVWEHKKYIQTELLYGFELEKANEWLENSRERKNLPPLLLHKKFIKQSSTSRPKIFISYGREQSKDFASQLCFRLIKEGFDVWFDKNDIPLGVDSLDKIKDGIEKSDNFIFIISPCAIKSEFCQKEIEIAVDYNKRIIPVLYIDTKDETENIHPYIEKLNKINFQEELGNTEKSFNDLIQILESETNYVKTHTTLLTKALEWEQDHRKSSLLLTDNDRIEAQEWLSTSFGDTAPPCLPTDLHCEFITESKKEAEGMMSDVFFSYAREDAAMLRTFRQSLLRHGLTTWTDITDIKKGVVFEEAIRNGIEQTDNFVFLISPNSVISKYCMIELEHVLKFKKRIIPVLIRPTENSEIPEAISENQYFDFTNLQIKKAINASENIEDKALYEKNISELVALIRKDQEYFKRHKELLALAIEWEKEQTNSSLLVRGHELMNAEAWLLQGKNRSRYQPISLHENFIARSREEVAQHHPEIFISYSNTNTDFANKINKHLKNHAKITWFDYDFISKDDYETEINNGIENSDNFLFIITPDSTISSRCEKMIKHAEKLNKRIIPIVYHHVSKNEAPVELSKLQWINFKTKGKGFTTAFGELLRTLDTDKEHVQKHTKYLQLAKEWDDKDRGRDLLLRGNEFVIAETWFSETVEQKKTPVATKLQEEWLAASQSALAALKRMEKRNALIVKGLLAVASIALIIAIYNIYRANIARKDAQKNEILAKEKGRETTEANKTLELRNKEFEELAERLANATSETERLRLARRLGKLKNETDSTATDSMAVDTFAIKMATGKFEANSKFGYKTPEGEVIIEPIYDEITMMQLLKVQKNGKWGVLDANGQEIIPVKYTYIGDFKGGVADFRYAGKWGKIKINGDILVSNSYGENK